MKLDLKQKFIVISGASSGIGRELCKIFIQKYNATVLGIARNEEKLRSLQKELGANFTYCVFDVSVQENWDNLAKDLTTQNIVPYLILNNAGVFPTFDKAIQTDPFTLEQVLKTNFFSAVYSVKALLPLVAPKGGMVNICSSAALCSVVGTSTYTATKCALKGYTECLRLEEKDKYIGLIFPGTTKTELFRSDDATKNSALDKIGMPPQKMAKKIARALLKRKPYAVLGWDAKCMHFIAKIAPVKGLKFICWVMKISKSKVFKRIF